MSDEQDQSNELITLDLGDAKLPDPVKVGTAVRDALHKIIEDARQEVAEFQHDLSTKASRKRTASLAYKISRLKTGLDAKASDLTEGQRKLIATVDAERKKMREELDALRDEARKPLDEAEARIAAQEKAADQARADMTDIHGKVIDGVRVIDMTSEQLRLFAGTIENRTFDAETYGEWADELADLRGQTHTILSNLVDTKAKAEADAAELAELRRQREEREAEEAAREAERKAEEEARIAREAEEKAEAERAAAAAKAEEERIEAERIAAEKAKAEAEERARLAEQQRQEDIERATREAEAAAKAAADAEIERIRQEAEAKIAAERKAAEAERQAAEKAKADEQAAKERAEAEAAKKAANLEHRRAINKEVMTDLINNVGLDEDTAKTVITQIAMGFIAHVTINY